MSTARARGTRKIKLGRHSNGMLMTPEEFDAVTHWDEFYRYELVHGVLIVSPAASRGETRPSIYLGYLLQRYQEDHPEGAALNSVVSECDLEVPNGRRRADLAAWTGLGRLPTEADVPTIAVEFVSRTTRDRVRDYEEKRREYLDFGVKEYWVIDRFRRLMTVFRPTADGSEELVVKPDAVYETPLLPGFQLPLAKVLEKADEWPDKARRKP